MSQNNPFHIPFNRPTFIGKEQDYMAQAIHNGHAAGDGDFTKKCHTLLEQLLGVPKVLLTTSCTHALEMTALLLNVQPGDEVIVPAFTFVSTINAFVLRGARPVFIDIRPDTLNLDETQLERLITPRTKAIALVHYAGVGCEMDAICEIADKLAIPLVEDNAHGLFAKYKGRYLGTFGTFATQSFHETKNFTCGEGELWSSTTRGISSARRSSERKAPTVADSFAVRWTSTPGLTLARAIFHQIFWRRSCMRNSKPEKKFKPSDARYGSITIRVSPTGRRRTM